MFENAVVDNGKETDSQSQESLLGHTERLDF